MKSGVIRKVCSKITERNEKRERVCSGRSESGERHRAKQERGEEREKEIETETREEIEKKRDSENVRAEKSVNE